MNIIVAFTYIVLAAILVAAVYGVVFSSLYGSNHSLTPNTPKGLSIDNRGLASYNSLASRISISEPLSAENMILVNSYTLQEYLKLYNWKANSFDFATVIMLMENIARSFIKLNDNDALANKKLKMLKGFVDEVDVALADKGTPITEIPWGDKVGPFSILLPRFLASYLITCSGSIDTLSRNKAVSLIKRLIPSYNTSLNKKYRGYTAVYLSIPYLIAILTERPEDIHSEKTKDKISEAYDFMNPQPITNETMSDNTWYKDLAYTIEKLEFSYTPLVALSDFYAPVWVSLGIPFEGKTVFANALDKLLHPTINIVPRYAFWGLCGIEHNFRFYDSKPGIGTYVYPEVGVGVYKTPHFYFHIRVQKQNQTMTSPLLSNDKYDALVALQSRKIYFSRDNADTAMHCDYNYHPNLIRAATDGKCDKFEGTAKRIADENTHSFIGIIEDNLIWLNEYQDTDLVNASIYEVGVFCINGCFQFYSIDNKGDAELQFSVAKGQQNARGYTPLPAGAVTNLMISQKIDNAFDPQLVHVAKYNFRFETPAAKYNVIYNPSSRVTTIRAGDRVFLFTESPKIKDTVTVNGKAYHRNESSLTYYA